VVTINRVDTRRCELLHSPATARSDRLI